MRRMIIGMLALVGWALPGHAAVIDQQCPSPMTMTTSTLGQFAQTFRVGLTGQLTQLDLFLDNPGRQSGWLLVDIRPVVLEGQPDDTSFPLPMAGSPVVANDQSLGQVMVRIDDLPRIAAPFVPIDLSPAGIYVTQDQVLAFVLRPQNGISYGFLSGPDSAYPEGTTFFRANDDYPFFFHASGMSADEHIDLGFRTYVSVPEPATLSTLVLGSWLLLYRRRVCASEQQ